MMPGMIMLWYGSVESIPSGWHLCDGTMGTPDLRMKSVFGANITAVVGLTGGSDSHEHELQGAGHSHAIEAGSGLAAGTDFNLETSNEPCTGDTKHSSSYPPYMFLCYIQKL